MRAGDRGAVEEAVGDASSRAEPVAVLQVAFSDSLCALVEEGSGERPTEASGERDVA